MSDSPEKPPPPAKKKDRNLSLKAAMAAATKRDSAEVKPMPLLPEALEGSPDTKSKSAKQQEMEAHLLELQAEIFNRESLLAEKEQYLETRTRELNEKEALLDAHKKLLLAKANNDTHNDTDPVNENDEMAAAKALQAELKTQEASLVKVRSDLQAREAYIERCENDLVEKSMQLTERETLLEEAEETHKDKHQS
jgi:hypothetical protein